MNLKVVPSLYCVGYLLLTSVLWNRLSIAPYPLLVIRLPPITASSSMESQSAQMQSFLLEKKCQR
jgi:hypothetical protein